MNRLISVFSMLLVLAGMSSAATTLGGCQEIAASGEYILSGGVSGATTSASPLPGMACFKITANDVELDCLGNTIAGPGPQAYDTYGVLIPDPVTQNVTVRDCVISDYKYGVLTKGNDGLITGNTISNSGEYGIFLNEAFFNEVDYNDLTTSGKSGIRLTEADLNTLTGNKAYQNTQHGIECYQSLENDFISNNVSDNLISGFVATYCNVTSNTGMIANDNAIFGIYYHESSYSSVDQTNAHRNGYDGVYFLRVTTNTITDSNLTYNMNGIRIIDSQYVDISNVITTSNSLDGILIVNMTNGSMGNVDADLNGDDAVDMEDLSGMIVDWLQMEGNSGDGLVVIGFDQLVLRDSTASDNGGAGFRSQEGDSISGVRLQSSGNSEEGHQIVNVKNFTLLRSASSGNGGDGLKVDLHDCIDCGFTVTALTANDNAGNGVSVDIDASAALEPSDLLIDLGTVTASRNGINGLSINGLDVAPEYEGTTKVMVSNSNFLSNQGDGILCNVPSQPIGPEQSGFEMEGSESSSNGGDGVRLVNVTDFAIFDSVSNDNGGYGWVFGLEDQLDHSGSVDDSEASGNVLAGIAGSNLYAINLTNVTAEENGLGIDIGDSDSVNMERLYLSHNTGTGLELNSVSNVLLKEDISTTFNGEDGIKVVDSTIVQMADIESVSNIRNGVSLLSSSFVTIRDSRGTICNNGYDGISASNSTDTSIINVTSCNNTEAGVRVEDSTDTAITDSEIVNNRYGVYFATSGDYAETTLTNNDIAYNTEEDIYVGADTDGDGVPDDEDDCPYTYGQTSWNGCPAAVQCKVTSNDVLVTGIPGQQPVEGSLCNSYKRTDACVNARHPDSTLIVEECEAFSSCVTDAEGLCLMGVEEALYYVAAVEPQHPGKYPAHDIGLVDASSSPKMARLAFLRGPDGKSSPGKSSKKTGSELWIYEPQYVIWDGTEEYYPFVFESSQDWAVDVCLQPPEGYQPADGEDCVQQLVAGKPRSILFRLVEVGSVPDNVKVKMKITDPHGKKLTVLSEVGTRLTEKLAKAKGVAIDKNGVVTGKAAGAGIPVNPMFVVLLIGAGLTVFVVDSFLRRKA